MNMGSMIERAHGLNAMILQDLSCDPPPPRLTGLHDIQIRAYRIHQKHGGVYGGYTLDEWLEAEHELDEEHREKRNKKEQPHSSGQSALRALLPSIRKFEAEPWLRDPHLMTVVAGH